MRAAPCWSLDVVKGGGELPFRSFASTFTTEIAAPSTCARAASACPRDARRGSVPSNLSLSPFQRTTRAGKAVSPFLRVTGTGEGGGGAKPPPPPPAPQEEGGGAVGAAPRGEPPQDLKQGGAGALL